MKKILVPREIGSEEELGRGVFSSRHAERAERSRVPHHIFLERPGITEISVDRLSIAPTDEAVAIAEVAAIARDASFYGWASVSADEAGRNARRVTASPLSSNPYHADIVLPGATAEDREEQKRHAQELADASHWRARPDFQQ